MNKTQLTSPESPYFNQDPKQNVHVPKVDQLFKNIKDSTYRQQFARLEGMRAKHPSRRDDELLIALLCWDKQLIG